MAEIIIDLSGKSTGPDDILFAELSFLKDLDPEARTAVVAGVFDPDTQRLFAATSKLLPQGVWHHAEFEALRLAREQGIDFKNSLFVSSLSPCVKDSSTRGHISCTSTLIGSEITSEYIGRLDRGAATPTQYEQMGLRVDLTTDPNLLDVCDRLYEFFNRFKRKGRTKVEIIDDALAKLA